MKSFENGSIQIALAVLWFVGLCNPSFSFAAPTTPPLGEAANYGVLGGTYVNTSAATTITGSVGFTTEPATAPLGLHPYYGVAGTVPTARTDANNALFTGLATQPCTLTFASAIVDLSTDVSHPTGVYTPGVYCSTGAMSIGSGGITLNGAGTYIFRADGALTTTDSSVVTLVGASACDVFWTPTAATTLGATTTFKGTIIDNATAITVGANTTWEGRALSLGAGVVSTGSTDTIAVPVCAPATGTLHIVKHVVTDNGGTATASDFTINVTGTNVSSSTFLGSEAGTDVTLDAGAYSIAETGPAGYAESATALCSGTIAAGETKTCTITNDDIAPTLHIVKTVTNDSGGSSSASNFNISVKLSGTDVSGSPAVGIVSPGRTYTISAGTYVVSEDANSSYAQSFSGDCDANGSVTLSAGEDKTCTITNNDVAPAPAILHIVKHVITDNGGTATASDFTINVTGTNVSSSSFAGSETGTDVTLDAGAYSIAETGPTTSYAQSSSADCSGTIAAGETKTCTITNDDIAPRFIVTKVVVNDSGRNKAIGDFFLFVNSTAVNSGVTNVFPVGTGYAVSETADASYTRTFSGDCDINGHIDLALGDNKACFVTNNDIAPSSGGGGYSSRYFPPVPPIIAVVKVPSPLSLPGGPGPVEYTYTIRNIGTVPVTGITMVGDTCSPIVLVSGDTNSDAKLDLTETWVHTCSTTLTETHTNTVVATGWANGISATDIASATVVVGIPIVPPLIHVTKVPSPLTLPVGGGAVTYNYVVTNPGSEPLGNVVITDDMCTGLPGRVIGHPGDLNGNDLLETNETWSFTCQSDLIQTTTNTATASGVANGLTARDFAIAHVVVANAVLAVPSLPNAGFASEEKSVPSNIIILYGVFMIISVIIVSALRKRKI